MPQSPTPFREVADLAKELRAITASKSGRQVQNVIKRVRRLVADNEQLEKDAFFLCLVELEHLIGESVFWEVSSDWMEDHIEYIDLSISFSRVVARHYRALNSMQKHYFYLILWRYYTNYFFEGISSYSIQCRLMAASIFSEIEQTQMATEVILKSFEDASSSKVLIKEVLLYIANDECVYDLVMNSRMHSETGNTLKRLLRDTKFTR